MNQIGTACRICEGVFSGHEVRLSGADPEKDRVLCPRRGSSRLEPRAFYPKVRAENPLEDEA